MFNFLSNSILSRSIVVKYYYLINYTTPQAFLIVFKKGCDDDDDDDDDDDNDLKNTMTPATGHQFSQHRMFFPFCFAVLNSVHCIGYLRSLIPVRLINFLPPRKRRRSPPTLQNMFFIVCFRRAFA